MRHMSLVRRVNRVKPGVSSLGKPAALEAELRDRASDPRPAFKVDTVVTYHGTLYSARQGHEARVHAVRERAGCPYVLEFRDGWRGIAEAEELSA